MQNNQANPDKFVQHLKATYGKEWPERILLSSFHLSYYILAHQSIHTDPVPPEVMEGIDTLYNVVYGLYDQD